MAWVCAKPVFRQTFFTYGRRGVTPIQFFLHNRSIVLFFSFFEVGGGVQKYHLALLVPFQILFGPFWLKNHRQRWKSENPALAQRSPLLSAILSKYPPGSKIPVSFPQYVKVWNKGKSLDSQTKSDICPPSVQILRGFMRFTNTLAHQQIHLQEQTHNQKI